MRREAMKTVLSIFGPIGLAVSALLIAPPPARKERLTQ